MSGDRRNCLKCGRETSWLDIVSSALTKTHQKALLAEVILGERKYVNVEVPRAIADLSCYNRKAAIVDLRSFKCLGVRTRGDPPNHRRRPRVATR